ncbi:MAG TPA: proline--tRNA ligase [archaeon]|nr:proline--tRNA ligase [archaeon]
MSEEGGITTKRSEDFSNWYLEVVRKGGFMDQRTPIKGFDVIMPWGYSIWEIIQKEFDAMIKEKGVQNAYFPLFIPESLIKKEEEHFAGFKAEVARVTDVGGEKLADPLIVRPTSEMIMYYMYKLWIRSYKDLPLKINQWNNIVRIDTKVTKPFIRGREFLWQEGHTAHATKGDAEEFLREIIGLYSKMYELFAIEGLKLVRPQHDTFPGAGYTIVFDTVVQDGKVVQGPGSHFLAQKFSEALDISFTDEHEQKQHVWQTCWGLTTRQIGILLMHHGDDKGAVLPPGVAPIQVVIIPILFKGKEEIVLEKAREIAKKLKARVYIDERNHTAGFKFNEWELKGVPLRIEIGPKDIEAGHITVARRDTREKTQVKTVSDVEKILETMQHDMLAKSQAFLKENIRDAKSKQEAISAMAKGGFVRMNWCGSAECDKALKKETGGEIRGTLWGKKEHAAGSCICCGSPAKHVAYAARAY